jgi:hypothetical protein
MSSNSYEIVALNGVREGFFMRKRQVHFMAFAALVFGAPALADIVTVAVSGSITSVGPYNLGAGGTLPIPIAIGDGFDAQFVYDSTIMDSQAAPTVGFYLLAPLSASITVNAQTFSVSPMRGDQDIDIADNLPVGGQLRDSWHAQASTNVGNSYYDILSLYFETLATGVAPTVNSSDQLLPPSSLPNWTRHEIRLTTFNGGYGLQAVGNVTALQVTAVPLPASAWLLLSGLAGCMLLSRRRVGRLSTES